MPRIHYPKGIGTSRLRGPKWPALPHPAAGSPFFTKAHETLTRRPGESDLSFPRTSPARPPQPEPVPKGRFPSHGGLPRPRHSSGLASGGSDLEGVSRRGPSRGSVSAGRSLRSRFFPRTGTCRLRHGSRFRLSSGPRPLAPTSACFSANLGAFNPRSYTLTDDGDSFGGPPLTTSRGLRGTRKAFPDAGGDDWRNPVIRALRAL